MNELKCPSCGKELKQDYYDCEMFECHNPKCKHYYDSCIGREELWQELIRTRKALEVALAELQEIDGCCEDTKYADNVYVGLDGHDTRNIALDVKKTITQIKDLVESKTALEQKDVK